MSHSESACFFQAELRGVESRIAFTRSHHLETMNDLELQEPIDLSSAHYI